MHGGVRPAIKQLVLLLKSQNVVRAPVVVLPAASVGGRESAQVLHHLTAAALAAKLGVRNPQQIIDIPPPPPTTPSHTPTTQSSHYLQYNNSQLSK